MTTTTASGGGFGAYSWAKECYAAWGVDTEAVLGRAARLGLSLHCWQGDDVGGFENTDVEMGGGLAVTGRYPGRARNVSELRRDLELALSLIPGQLRVNLHASYGEFGAKRVDRNEIEPGHFNGWMDWAGEQGVALDFNPTFFAHRLAEDGFTLAHPEGAIREFWVEHGVRARRIGAAMGARQSSPCVTNVWIPDGYKDTPVDRMRPRVLLEESLDRVFAEPLDPSVVVDAVEPKLFGLGSESYVVGSHEFYLGYAIAKRKWLCLDSGHYHPTEGIADKVTAILPRVPGLLLHISRGVRWDSDHVVLLNDEVQSIACELTGANAWERVALGLDYFDASINRVAAWVVGARNVRRALLMAALLPWEELKQAERAGDFTRRLVLQEEAKSMPWGAVWEELCRREEVPVGREWLDSVRRYEASVLAMRSAT